MLAASAGWRLDSWDTLTSSIYHTQACRLGRQFCGTLSRSDGAAPSDGVPYHDLAGDVTHFSVSDVLWLFGSRRVFPLEERRHGECEQHEHARD